jgi:hypothetical protein
MAECGGSSVIEHPASGFSDRDKVNLTTPVAPLVGQLPLGEERAIVELKARGLLGDVDVDRGPRE